MHDTIVHIITAPGSGAVSIVRMSGALSVDIAKQLFTCKRFADNPKTHNIYYGHITDNGQIIDEALLTFMQAPKSYTKEDVVEINCHGGQVCALKVLSLCVRAGARIAEPGEFTKRAFLNGRIDLSQAEAVSDLIYAKSDHARDISAKQLSGGLQKTIRAFREEILSVTAGIEASIDFPEHDLETVNISIAKRTCTALLEKIEALIKSADYGKIVHAGINTVIAGRANVGKSSLLNAVLNEDRAIVTHHAGTTRDILCETVNINGILLNLKDTAGIRETDNEIETHGIDRAKEALENADLVLFVVDGSEELTDDDKRIFRLIGEKTKIILINKQDLPQKADLSVLNAHTENIINISAKYGTNIALIYEKINEMFLSCDLTADSELVLYKKRHVDCLIKAADSLARAAQTAKSGTGEELLYPDLMDAYTLLGEITGETTNEDVIDRIFAEFCIGK